MTSDQHDPSANSPCTSTTLRAFVGEGIAAIPRAETSEAATPATRVAEKARLLIAMIFLPFSPRALSNVWSRFSACRFPSGTHSGEIPP
jgi:hypothetical protein